MHDPRVTCCRWDDLCIWTILGASLLGTIAYVTAADPLGNFGAPPRRAASISPSGLDALAGDAASCALREIPTANLHPPASVLSAPPDSGKPSQPIGLTLWFEKQIGGVGSTGEIGIWITPQIDAPVLEVELVLPDGVVQQGGVARWQGTGAKGIPKAFLCTCCCTADGHHEIIGRATIRYPNGTTFTANDSLICESGDCKPAPAEGVEKTAPDGTKIREFPAQSPK